MRPCCYVELKKYQPQPNPYNSHLYQRNGWMPPNPFTQSQYVLEHYRPNPAAYCCGNSVITTTSTNTIASSGGCCGR